MVHRSANLRLACSLIFVFRCKRWCSICYALPSCLHSGSKWVITRIYSWLSWNISEWHKNDLNSTKMVWNKSIKHFQSYGLPRFALLLPCAPFPLRFRSFLLALYSYTISGIFPLLTHCELPPSVAVAYSACFELLLLHWCTPKSAWKSPVAEQKLIRRGEHTKFRFSFPVEMTAVE